MSFFERVVAFSTPGSYTYTIPNYVNRVVVECWGAGGAGGNGASQGSGGGGGSYSRSVVTVSGGETIYYFIGEGGLTTASSGNPGQNTWASIVSNSETTAFCKGARGLGGVSGAANPGGFGGNISDSVSNIITFSGGNGGDSQTGGGTRYGSGGGGSGGSLGQGSIGAEGSGSSTAGSGGTYGGNLLYGNNDNPFNKNINFADASNGFRTSGGNGATGAATVSAIRANAPGGGGGGSSSVSNAWGSAGANGQVNIYISRKHLQLST